MPRKEKKYHFIYKTTNLLSGRYYIGMHSTDNLDDGYLGSGTRLKRALNKHGEENFKREILEFCKTRKELKAREEEIVSMNEIAKVDCMNLKVGGTGTWVGLSEEAKNRIKNAVSKNMKRIFSEDPEYVAKFQKASREGVKRAHKLGKYKTGKDKFDWTGKKHSEETKKKISESKRGQGSGNNNSQFGTCWITNGSENKKIMRGDEIPAGWRLGRKMK